MSRAIFVISMCFVGRQVLFSLRSTYVLYVCFRRYPCDGSGLTETAVKGTSALWYSMFR